MRQGPIPTRQSPTDPAPHTGDLELLRASAAACTACPLYQRATQTVFGEGPSDAPMVLVGEQPGDSEDRAGRAFIGSAGKLLNRALVDAGIDRSQCYVTNAVKHFKWELKGKLHMHQTPGPSEIAACRPWLMEELAIIRPRVLICLGATAVRSVLGAQVRVLRDRGKTFESEFCNQTVVTVHPSSLLRIPDPEDRRVKYGLFVDDLRGAVGLL